MSYSKVAAMMVLGALFWSGAFVTGKFAIQQFPPMSMTFFRFLFALPFIFGILYYRQSEQWLPKRCQWPPIVLLGISGTFLYHVLFFGALQYTTAISAALIGASNPMVTTLIAVLVCGELLSIVQIIGIVLSFIGVVLVVTGGSLATFSSAGINQGDVMMFAAVCAWAVYSVLSRRVMERYQISPLLLTSYTFLVCTIVALPCALWEQPMVYLSKTLLSGWLSLLYMAVFASVLGYLFQLVAIQHIGAPRAAIFINLVPVFTIGQAWWFLGELVTVWKLLSAAVIIGGVYLTLRPAGDRSAAKA